MEKKPSHISYSTDPLEITVRKPVAERRLDRHETNLRISPNYGFRPLTLDGLKSGVEGRTEYAIHYPEEVNDSGNIIMVTMGWGGDFRTDVALAELGHIAGNNPKHAILVINNPGKGRSEPIPRSAMKEMKKSGSFMPYGEIIANDIERVLADFSLIRGTGYSMGGRALIGAATSSDTGFEFLSVTDPPGSHRLGLAGIADRFMIKEGEHTKHYLNECKNNTGKKAQMENDKKTLESILQMSLRAIGQTLISQPIAMGKGGLYADLEKLAKSGNVSTLQINSPEFSELNNPDDIMKILEDIAQIKPELNIRQVMINGNTHSMVAGGNTHVSGILSNPDNFS